MNVYSLYRTHTQHFAIYGAMFIGQYTPALKAAQELIDIAGGAAAHPLATDG